MARRTSQGMMKKELVHLSVKMTIKVNSSLGCVFPSAHVSFLFFWKQQDVLVYWSMTVTVLC